MKARAQTALLLMACAARGLAQQSSVFQHPAADPQHHLTGREFLIDIGGNFQGLFSVQNILPAIAWGAAYGVATIQEQSLERHFAPGNVWGKWAAPGRYNGNAAVLGGASGVLFAVSRKSQDRRFRSFSYALVQGMIIDTALVWPAKAAFHRLRPNAQNHQSFPSGHSSSSFVVATIFAGHYGWKAAIPGYAIASYVAATRMADRKHHITDVAGGAAMGYLIGRTVSRRMRTGSGKKVSWQVFPSGRGFIGTVRFQLP